MPLYQVATTITTIVRVEAPSPADAARIIERSCIQVGELETYLDKTTALMVNEIVR